FKDRVVSVAATKAREFGFDTLACASTGNLANSVSAHAARAGMDAYVFIPSDLEQGKVIGAAVYAPTLVAVDGSYDDVNRLCSELSDKYPWAFVNINVRPYYAEGSKTLAYEVCEQLGWQSPDHCIVPMASGSLFTKVYKGLKELSWLGLVNWSGPRMSGAQALGCSPIIEALERDSTNIRPQKPNTIAKSLAIDNPADGCYALKTIAQSGGTVTIAALKRMCEQGSVDADELTVAFITGAGLKTQEAVVDALTPALRVQPAIASFEEALSQRHGVLPAARS